MKNIPKVDIKKNSSDAFCFIHRLFAIAIERIDAYFFVNSGGQPLLTELYRDTNTTS